MYAGPSEQRSTVASIEELRRSAKADFQRALGIVRDQPLSEAELRVSMGSLFALQGSFSDAEANLKSAIATFTKYAGPNDLRTAKAWNGLGWLYTARGSMQSADEALRKADSIAYSAVPSGSVDRIPFLDYRAEWLMQVGKYTDAERLWREAAAIGAQRLGKESPSYDVVWLHMGHLYTSIGEYKEAQDALERFLSIEAKVMPRGSLAQGVALGELGNTYAHLKDHSEQAEPTLLRSMDMLRTIPGNVPLANALVGSYLGDYYMSQRRWSDAANQYQLVLETRQELIPNTALVANSMGSLAKALEKLNRKHEAKRYKKQAQAILSQQYNPLYSGNTVDVKSFRAR
ncbi:MAG TPA: tetratricopeptide repeat protein [Bryobacteraceae bacterium]|nr:tetratricopeptide repeat protein [Bryobacteraceae bacterium]